MRLFACAVVRTRRVLGVCRGGARGGRGGGRQPGKAKGGGGREACTRGQAQQCRCGWVGSKLEASAHCASRALLPVLKPAYEPAQHVHGRRPDSAAIATLWCSGARCVSSASHNPGHIIIINRWRIEEASYSGMFYSGFSIRHKFSALAASLLTKVCVDSTPATARSKKLQTGLLPKLIQTALSQLLPHDPYFTKHLQTRAPHVAGSIASSPPAPFDTRVRLCMTDVPCICIVTSSPRVTYFS